MEGEITVSLPSGPLPERFVIRVGQRFEAGRSPQAVLSIRDHSVSRRHAQVELRADGCFYVADLNSRNGTFVGEQRLQPYRPQLVSPGTPVRLGVCDLALRLSDDPASNTPETGKALEIAPMGLPADEFEILGVLGRGGTGVVYAARQVLMNRRVAIKCLKGPARDNAHDRERFLSEARLTYRVRSPYVVEVYDARIHEGQAYIVMELVEGMNLADPLQRGPIKIDRALKIAAQIAEGLRAAHKEGVIHRDVKPSNVLLGPEGQAKLTDFGIALDLARPDGVGLTPSGQGLGTLAYIAPEQARSARTSGPLVDVFGLGATLYHMIGGRSPRPPKPRTGQSMAAMLAAPPKLLHQIAPDCSREVSDLVARMLDPDPSKRPQSAEEAGELMNALLPAETEKASTPSGGTTWEMIPASFLPQRRQARQDLAPETSAAPPRPRSAKPPGEE